MAESQFSGQVVADVVEVRFSSSGKISKIAKKVGDLVKSGEIIAGLDRKIFQTELDKELSDYDRTRAEFEIFVKKNGEPADEISKYQKIQTQSLLNASVKAVELAKFRLDSCELLSPVSGQILEDGGNRVGLNISPASNAYKILDTSTIRFQVSLSPDKLSLLSPQSKGVVSINETQHPVTLAAPYLSGIYYLLDAKFIETKDLAVGLTGKLSIS